MPQMQHTVHVVSDDALPEGHDYVLVQHEGGFDVFYREGAISAGSVGSAWAAYRALAEVGPPRRLRSVS